MRTAIGSAPVTLLGMSVVSADPPVASEPEAHQERAGAAARPSWLRRHRTDLLVLAGYIAAGVYLYLHLWVAPGERRPQHSYSDFFQFEWFLTADTRALLGLHNPFFNDLQNASVGVNMMANTSVLGLAVPLLPVTLLFGAATSFVVAATLGFALTAFGWHLVLHRDLDLRRSAAVLGGAAIAFAPPLVAHGNAHLNMVSLFVVPLIVRYSLRLFRTERPVHDGLRLGALIVWQCFIGEEVLLMAALSLAFFVLIHAIRNTAGVRAMVRPFLTGIGTALAVSLPLLAYPIYWQFLGTQSYSNIGYLAYVTNDLNTFTEYSTKSLGNDSGVLTSTNYAEENAYFGWALPILAIAIFVWLWRDRLARTTAIVGGLFALMSMGPEIILHKEHTGWPGLWRLFVDVPLLDSMNVGRFTFVTVAALGVMLAVATDRILRAAPHPTVPVRLIWAGALAAALVPLLPVPLPAVGLPPVPRFITSGHYRDYVAQNHTMVPVPPIDANSNVLPLGWQVAAGMDFRLPEGYFMGPVGEDREADNQPPKGPTSTLVLRVFGTGKAVTPTAAQREAILAELRRIQADALVAYGPQARTRLPELKATLDPLLGPAKQVDDVWVWDVRALTG
ncbi:glycosyl transferase [Dactylosporangium vinaceum]